MLVELSMVEQRYQVVREVLDTGATITDVASRYGVDLLRRGGDYARTLVSTGHLRMIPTATAVPIDDGRGISRCLTVQRLMHQVLSFATRSLR